MSEIPPDQASKTSRSLLPFPFSLNAHLITQTVLPTDEQAQVHPNLPGSAYNPGQDLASCIPSLLHMEEWKTRRKRLRRVLQPRTNV